MTKHLLAGTHEIERIVFHACEELDANTFEKLQFVRALKKHYVGIGIFTKPRKVGSSLVECVKKMVKEHHRGDESNDKEAPDCEKNSKIEITEYGSRKGFDYGDIISIFMFVYWYCCVDVCGRQCMGFHEDLESSQKRRR